MTGKCLPAQARTELVSPLGGSILVPPGLAPLWGRTVWYETGHKRLASLGRRSYRETQDWEKPIPVQRITFLKSSLVMVAVEGCMQRERPQGYRNIALSILFPGQLQSWRVSLCSQPGLDALEQWQGALGVQKFCTRTRHCFSCSQRPRPHLSGEESKQHGVVLTTMQLNASSEAGWPHLCILLATVPRPCCSLHWAQECF